MVEEKSDELSIKHRAKGNKLFLNEEQFHMALVFYNKVKG